MEVLELLQDYLIDQEEGMKNLLTWFLNLVMQFEAFEQAGADPYEHAKGAIFGLARLKLK